MTPREVIVTCLNDWPLDHPTEGATVLLEALAAAGFAIVPVEPTEAMVRASNWQLCGSHDIWRNMIRAAQETDL